MEQNKSPKAQNPKPETIAKAQTEEKSPELTEDDLESISGGTTSSPSLNFTCTTGKHFPTGTIIVR